MGIKKYILTIVSAVILSALTEAIMPESKMKKHISLVVGLVMLVAITRPLLHIRKYLIEDMTFRLEDAVDKTSSLINEKLTNAQYNAIDNTFERSLSSSLENSVLKTFGVERKIEAEAHEGQVTKVLVYGKSNDEVKMHIKQNFGLECEFTDDGG